MDVRFLIIAVNVHNLGSYFLGFYFFFNFIIYLFIYLFNIWLRATTRNLHQALQSHRLCESPT